MNVATTSEALTIEADAYVAALAFDRPFVVVHRRGEPREGGRPVARLNPLAAVDTAEGLDGTVGIGEPSWSGRDGSNSDVVVTLPVRSARWARKVARIRFAADEIGVSVEVDGSGTLTDVTLLGGWYPTDRRWGAGWYRSHLDAATLVSAAPADPRTIAASAAEPAVLGVSGGGQPGRGSWFFTPPPFVLAFSGVTASRRDEIPPGPWATVSVRAPAGSDTFGAIAYEPLDGAFHLRLSYDGQTTIADRWASPEAVVRFGAADPYAAIADERCRVGSSMSDRAGASMAGAAAPAAGTRPAWWSQPIFCGWGAQCASARLDGDPSAAADRSTAANYDRFLEHLEANGIVPGTIVVDDRWQRSYGSAEPDPARWPDLGGWIRRRHARGQRVLLWWKAWAPDGLPVEWCVRTADGRPVTADPSNPEYRAHLGAEVRRLLAAPPEGLGADGLKIDFTAQTPAGPGLVRHGPEWGVALLRRLLETIHDAAKSGRPDAFVVAHAPNPSFAHVADAVRLNDLLRLDDRDPWAPVVAQARHRAAIARAACPELLVETDDWAVPSLAEWRAYLRVKATLGIPSLYYADRVDPSGEPLEETDYAAIRAVWHAWRESNGLSEPRPESDGLSEPHPGAVVA